MMHRILRGKTDRFDEAPLVAMHRPGMLKVGQPCHQQYQGERGGPGGHRETTRLALFIRHSLFDIRYSCMHPVGQIRGIKRMLTMKQRILSGKPTFTKSENR